MGLRKFPVPFMWGVATAGHQIEGDNRTSDTWYLENVEPTIFMERSGKACNSYELWEEDLDLARGLGLNAFRFSVEWARIEPSEGVFDEEALAHYDAIVDGCVARGLSPIVTFNHFTSPHWFAKRAGWLDAAAPGVFARFCAHVTDRIGDRIEAAVTLNEPNLPRMLAWAHLPDFVVKLQEATLDAASTAADVARYRASNVMLAEDFAAMQEGMTNAHRAARKAIKEKRPDLPVGLSIAVIDDCSTPGGEQRVAEKRADVYDHWLHLAQEDDFIGVQNYERVWYGPDGQLAPAADAVLNSMGTEIEPASLGGAVRHAYEVSGRPVLVTEHGVGMKDDAVRAAFIEPALAGLLDVIESGVPVIGYCHWTLLDNFEWIFGYGPRFGLFEVDRKSFVRTPKPSSTVFASIVEAQGD